MSGFRDPAIKLFGKTISLQRNQKAASASALVTDVTSTTSKATSASVSVHKQHPSHDDTITSNKGLNEQVHDQYEKKPSGGELTNHEICSTNQGSEDLKHPTKSSSAMCENQKSPSVNKETASPESPGDGEQSDTSSSQEKTLKKPDKIIPCPRCNSMDTKFCYYNNYNVNQPRHFCKNCQRYWTAGGTMRNVPVGAGRRKNKHSSASHYGNILVSEALHSARANASSGLHHPQSTLLNNGSVLNFGSDAPLCDSMVSALKIAEKNQTCFIPSRFQEGREIGDDQSSNSNTVALNSAENGLKKNAGSQEQLTKNFQGFPVQAPWIPGTPWQPAFCPPGFPISFYQPPTYWGCTLPGSWTMPWLSPPPNSPNHSFVSSSPSSPTFLGKHSRNGNILNSSCNSEKEELSKENNSERGVWIPKTLRIDDSSEAAKSSIWATLGIKDEKISSKNSGGGLFKSFRTKGVQEEDRIGDTLSVLQANPAAMSRALSFHETT